MKRSSFTEELIIGCIRQAAAGMPIKELCRKKAGATMPRDHERVPLQLAQNVNEVWSMDFVRDNEVRPHGSIGRIRWPDSRSCIASALTMQLEPLQSPRRSINPGTPDFLNSVGTPVGVGQTGKACGCRPSRRSRRTHSPVRQSAGRRARATPPRNDR